MLGVPGRGAARGAVRSLLCPFRVPRPPARQGCCPCEASGPHHRHRDCCDVGRASRSRRVGVYRGRVRWVDKLGRREMNGNEDRRSGRGGRRVQARGGSLAVKSRWSGWTRRGEEFQIPIVLAPLRLGERPPALAWGVPHGGGHSRILQGGSHRCWRLRGFGRGQGHRGGAHSCKAVGLGPGLGPEG